MPQFTVKYYAGPYSGMRTVTAEDPEDAIDQVRGWVHREMTLPMYTEGYQVIDTEKKFWDEF